MIPTLHTDRLTLRPHRFEDFETYVAMWADPGVVRFIGGKPFDRETSWARFLRQAGMWHHLGFGFLVIEETATGTFLGEAGFHDMHRAMEPSIEGTMEAGWVLSPTAHGKGYATEAMQRMIDWAGETFPAMAMTCIIDPANQPSLRVANRLGFIARGEATYHGAPITLLDRKPR